MKSRGFFIQLAAMLGVTFIVGTMCAFPLTANAASKDITGIYTGQTEWKDSADDFLA